LGQVEDEKAMNDQQRALGWFWAAMVGAGAVVALLVGAHAGAVTPPTIAIKEFKYAPSLLTVPVGTTVTWVNHDEEPHTVTSTAGAFGSGGLVNDDSFVQTFAEPGTYEYFCAIHPYMRATVVVK
jgi:plastocyanin